MINNRYYAHELSKIQEVNSLEAIISLIHNSVSVMLTFTRKQSLQ